MPGTMSLNGTFDASDLPEVLGLLNRRGCTGRFQLRAGSRHVLIRLVDGNAVAVEGAGAAGADGAPDVRVCLEDAFFETLRMGRGSFEFQPEQAMAQSEPGRGVRMATAVAAAQQRLEEWREVEAVIPSLEAVPRLADELRAKELTLSQEQWRIVVAVDGRRTVGGIARRLGCKPVALCKALKPLVEEGAISFERHEPLAARDLPLVGLHRSTDEASRPAAELPAAEGEPPRRRARGAAFRVLARD